MFIDYAKAFDTVKHYALLVSLLECYVPKRLMQLVRKLYTKSTGVVRVGDEQSDEFPFEKRVRQG